MVPSVIQFSHLFEEDHEHIACTETQSHMHQSEVDCEICAFRILPFNNNFNDVVDFSPKKLILKRETAYVSLVLEDYYFTNKQLRAPPIHS